MSARMVDNLEEYEWSSYSAYIDKIKSPVWLVREEVYGQLTQTEHKAEQYRCFMVNEDLDKKLIKFYSQKSSLPILGDDAFGLQHYGGASYAVHAFAQELRKDRGLETLVIKVVNKLGMSVEVDQST